ncbi:hypothetical protein GCM10025881_02040 [Pseudolysinimonas kribbensis]|uniref:Probable peptidoglycan glycosyltransferase FtsW n=1 Tax=Pseudolysinimonas kribbensis TaxID=433641 RepID=A0ABQ6K1H6_9MICO|nr:hypothetical protein GCM10025881_02040 [Pseudolysinimonas kribbensis]
MTTTSSRRTPRPGPERRDRSGADSPRPSAAVVAVQRIFSAETPEYFLLLGTTLFLVVFGLIMVLSSSSIESYVNNDKDFFATATRQGLYVLIGLPVMLIAARAPLSFWKRWAGPAVIAGVVLQLLVFTPLGYGYGGNQNWIKVGSFTAQPSELIKLAFVIWLAWILSRRLDDLHDWKRALIPIGPVVAVSIGLVLVGRDLGTALIMVAIVFGAMFIAGTRLRILGVVIVIAGVVGMLVLSVSESRVGRIQAWLGGCKDPTLAASDCYQTLGAGRRSRTAACWGWASATRPRSGTGCRRPRTTSSSPSSARSWACSARSSCSCCSSCWRSPSCASSGCRTTRSPRSRRARPWSGSSARPS